MSSGERAKPPQKSPGTYEERNPFDISRRSQKEVASEIAQRMVAWKQARGRSYPTPGTMPPSREGQPPVAAPGQPAHAPKLAEQPAQAPRAPQAHESETPRAPRAPAAAPAGREARAPLFATASIQRAMPPAPSPRQSAGPGRMDSKAARAEAGSRDDRTVSGPEDNAVRGERPHARAEPLTDAPPALPAAETTESAAHRTIVEKPLGDPPAAASPGAHADSATETAIEPDGLLAIDPMPPAGDADEMEARRAKARDIRARWMAAHEFEGVPATAEQETRAAAPEVSAAAERGVASQTVASQTAEAPHIAAAVPSIEALDEMSGRQEPTFNAPADAPAPADTAAGAPTRTEMRDESPAVEAPGTTAIPPVEALDGLAGRKEPTFDAVRPSEAAGAPALATRQEERPLAKSATLASPAPPIETLDAAAGRREPTFDALPGKKQGAAVRLAASDANAPRPKQRIEMPTIQTRIEARRMEALRADPHMAGRRAKRPRVEPEAWEVMPPVAMPPIAMPARRERRSTSWAIALGAILLIIGVTAPAAILRQGWQSAPVNQDQPVTDPISSQDQASQAPAPSDEPAATQAPPAGPQPQQAALPPPPPRPAASERSQSAENAQPPVNAQVSADESSSGQADASKQAILGPVRDRGELNDAPVSAPPPPDTAQAPLVNLASQDTSRPPFRQTSPMVARPFTPQQPAARPFFPAPAPSDARSPKTVGTATIPIGSAGGDASGDASIGLKPSLIPVLKPKAAATRTDSDPSPTPVRKPKPFVPQSVEQMFQHLVDTLSEGQPPNPDLQPPSPSARR